MPKGSVNFLFGYLIMLLVYGLMFNMITEQAIETGEFPAPPTLPIETEDFFDNLANAIGYMTDMILYLISIMFFNDPTIAIVSTIFVIFSLIALYIIIRDIIIPFIVAVGGLIPFT